ncbi:unnamed protein product [Triticum aestivum]|uniref:CASP-like protein n=2 Tax=Triticum aestivum TaxID=4565 RepID=A0A9R1EQB1_WHEAT|nr:uncharacterized protein LOC123048806 isoform X2 [Triticum aestivum]KAF7014264.1 hypothetical protein CFC21_028280 [Triticum aestivum]SPT16497.1 unnamed protein product [Triticum aestivum]
MAAGRMLELLVFFSTAGSLLLDLAAVLVCILAGPYYPTFRLPNQLMWWTSFCGAVPWGAVLLMLQVNCWCHGWEATNVDLLVLSAVEWVVACSTFGSACAALAVDHLAVQNNYCGPSAAVCSVYLVAAAISCAAGALAAASALGMLWILASRFRPVHAA